MLDKPSKLMERLSRRGVDPVASTILASIETNQIYAFGRNEHAWALNEALSLEGIVDDFTSDSEWNGLPIIKLEDLPERACVVNCVFSIHAVSAYKRLLAIAPDQSVSYHDLRHFLPDIVPELSFAKEAHSSLVQYSDKWDWLDDQLDDEKSKQVLSDLISFRMTGDAEYLKEYQLDLENQYFDPVAPIKNGDVIVDGGSYDGDTAKLFLSRYPEVEAVHLFEPSAKNMLAAKQSFKGQEKAHFHEKALSDKRDIVRFNDVGGTISAISDSGPIEVQADTLDNCLAGQSVSFIKLDIEGHEMAALKGAEQTILKNHPTLAICVYHKTDDFWQVPEYLLSLNKNYKINLRHYTEGWSETVMYFTPIK